MISTNDGKHLVLNLFEFLFILIELKADITGVGWNASYEGWICSLNSMLVKYFSKNFRHLDNSFLIWQTFSLSSSLWLEKATKSKKSSQTLGKLNFCSLWLFDEVFWLYNSVFVKASQTSGRIWNFPSIPVKLNSLRSPSLATWLPHAKSFPFS